MHRNRFRSQPTLQRTGSRPSIWPWALGAAVIGFGAMIAVESNRFASPPAPDVSKTASSSGPTAPNSTVAMTDAPAVVPAAPTPDAVKPTVASNVAEPQAARKPPPRRKAPAIAAVTPPTPPAQAPAPAETRQDYELALASYQKNERLEGYRWAQANHVARVRYCRDAGKRTPAFMEGCLNYLRKTPQTTGDAAQDVSGREPD
jgi:hypothetical protein